jgi:hypothetical protein
VVWVRLPMLGADGVRLYAYFGNPAVADGSQPDAVWSDSFLSVWHLGDNIDVDPTVVAESSGADLAGSPLGMTGAANEAAGQVGGALYFDGSDDAVAITGSSTSALDVTSSFTLSAWVLLEQESGGTVMARRNRNDAQWQLEIERIGGTVPRVAFIRGSGAGTTELCLWAVEQPIALDEWHHVAVTVNAAGNPGSFFIDGAATPFSQEQSCVTPPLSIDFDVTLGARWHTPPAIGFPFKGRIDEARIESVARSAEEIRLQAQSMMGTRTTFGMVEAF